MKTFFKKKLSFKHFGFLLLLIFTLQESAQSQVVIQAGVVAPTWAPVYDNVSQVQYYYLPDLEVYYDVWHHEFVYLEDGIWLFAPVLPPRFGNYDLYGGHVVILDYRIHQPWMHHELYSAHYPKYYHHSVYVRERGEYSTGFDENTRRSYYGARINSEPNGGRPVAIPQRNEEHERHGEEHTNQSTSRREPVHYQERMVGQPVKVQKNMMRPKNNGEQEHENRR